MFVEKNYSIKGCHINRNTITVTAYLSMELHGPYTFPCGTRFRSYT